MSQTSAAECNPHSEPAVAESEQVALDPGTAAQGEANLVESELLVEDVSIDGMCGVY